MAKIEGTQDIPSELKYLYDGALTPIMPNAVVRGRYPWRIPKMQKGGSGVSVNQEEQRSRWLAIQAKFNLLSQAEKERWYAAAPQWHSLLFYYNYFMMSGLMGNAVVGEQGGGVIKSIQVMRASVPVSGTHIFTLPTPVIAAKTVIMIQGSSRKVPRVLRGSGSIAVGGSTLNIGDTVDPAKCSTKVDGGAYLEVGAGLFVVFPPYVSALSATQISIAWSTTPDAASVVGWEVIEHVEGSVYPVLVSVSNTQVTIDWAEVPNAAADVSITAIEYL